MNKTRETINEFIEKYQKNWPEMAQTSQPEIFKIHRLHEHFQHDLINLLTQYQLQQADFSVLSTLRRSPEPYCLTPTELASAMLFSSGGLTKVLNRVTQLELVERLENPADKRSRYVQLTAKGIKLIETIMPQVQRLEDKRQVLNETEKCQLNELLDKVLTHWESHN